MRNPSRSRIRQDQLQFYGGPGFHSGINDGCVWHSQTASGHSVPGIGLPVDPLRLVVDTVVFQQHWVRGIGACGFIPQLGRGLHDRLLCGVRRVVVPAPIDLDQDPSTQKYPNIPDT